MLAGWGGFIILLEVDQCWGWGGYNQYGGCIVCYLEFECD